MVLVNDVLEHSLNELFIRPFLLLQNIFDRFQPIYYDFFLGVSRSFGDDHADTAQEVITEGF